MSGELVVAVLSSAVALASVAISVWSARSTARLQNELEERRRQASKEELVEEVMSRYREPLLRAAFDLQSRIYNIVGQGFLHRYLQLGDPANQEYACRNTVFVVAEYLGWVEILRRGVQFLDLGDVRRNQLLVERLEAIGTILSTDRQFQGAVPRMFRGEQRAVGELMMQPTQAGEQGRSASASATPPSTPASTRTRRSPTGSRPWSGTSASWPPTPPPTTGGWWRCSTPCWT